MGTKMENVSSRTKKKALLLIDRVLSTAMVNTKNPDSIPFSFLTHIDFIFL